MFGIGGFELFIILLFGFIIFGPDKLPDIAKTVGRGIARFREAQQEMNETLGADKLIDLNDPDEPFKNPIEALDKIAQRQEAKKAEASASGNGGKEEKAAGSDKAATGQSAEDGQTKPESFTERKARYERERAARKAAEAEGANAAPADVVSASETDAKPTSEASPDTEAEPVPETEAEAELEAGPAPEPVADTPASDRTDVVADPSEGGDA